MSFQDEKKRRELELGGKPTFTQGSDPGDENDFSIGKVLQDLALARGLTLGRYIAQICGPSECLDITLFHVTDKDLLEIAREYEREYPR